VHEVVENIGDIPCSGAAFRVVLAGVGRPGNDNCSCGRMDGMM
jgi:hypothetical protein